MATDPPGTGAKGRRWRFSPAWFAGTDLSILARTPNERRFYSTLGLTVGMMCALSGLSFTLAAGFWLGRPADELWWLGLGWMLLMACGIEPLVYQMTSTRRRYLPLVLAPRVALSLLLAIQIGEPLVLRINHDAIDEHLARTRAVETRHVQRETNGFYNARIGQKRARIAVIRRHENDLREEISHNKFLSSCEAGTPSCSTTGELGCHAYCVRYQERADNAAERLAAIEPTNRTRIAQFQSQIDSLTNRRDAADESQVDAIGKNGGLPAREQALAEIEDANPRIRLETWFLRLLFLALDLTPLAIKVVRMLSTKSAYEDMVQAWRDYDAADAHAYSEQARVRVHEATVQAEAQMAVASEEARASAMSRINRIWARYRGPTITPNRREDGEEQRSAA